MKRFVRPLALAAGGAAASALLYAGMRNLRPGGGRATPAEAAAALPGDEILPEPAGSFTHAITIQRPRSEVWPWLVQMGGDRAGWYSYDLIDNAGRPSFDHLDPRLQEIGVGDVLPSLPGATEGFTVLDLEPERWLVLGWLPPSGGLPVLTWSFALESPGEGCTRLLARARLGENYQPPFGLPDWTIRTLVPWGHGVMQEKQLRGIRARAERGSDSRTRMPDLLRGARVGLLACCTLLAGCGIPLPLLHGPVPLPAGTASVGAGAAPLVPSGRADDDAVDQLLLSMFVSQRVGVDGRAELGAGFGLYNGFSLDGKYLLVPGPVAVSGSLALSTGGVPLGIHPALLVGGERLYLGGRAMTFPGSFAGVYPGVYAGASLGGRVRIVPEAAWLRDPDEGRNLLTLGAKVERHAATDLEASGFVAGWLAAMATLFELLLDFFRS